MWHVLNNFFELKKWETACVREKLKNRDVVQKMGLSFTAPTHWSSFLARS